MTPAEMAQMRQLLLQMEESIERVGESLYAMTGSGGDLSKTVSQLPVIDRVNFFFALSYALNSTIFCMFHSMRLIQAYMRIRGIDVSGHPIIEELNRLKNYQGKIKNAQESKPRSALDNDAANRIIRHALSQPAEPPHASLPSAPSHTRFDEKLVQDEVEQRARALEADDRHQKLRQTPSVQQPELGRIQVRVDGSAETPVQERSRPERAHVKVESPAKLSLDRSPRQERFDRRKKYVAEDEMKRARQTIELENHERRLQLHEAKLHQKDRAKDGSDLHEDPVLVNPERVFEVESDDILRPAKPFAWAANEMGGLMHGDIPSKRHSDVMHGAPEWARYADFDPNLERAPPREKRVRFERDIIEKQKEREFQESIDAAIQTQKNQVAQDRANKIAQRQADRSVRREKRLEKVHMREEKKKLPKPLPPHNSSKKKNKGLSSTSHTAQEGLRRRSADSGTAPRPRPAAKKMGRRSITYDVQNGSGERTVQKSTNGNSSGNPKNAKSKKEQTRGRVQPVQKAKAAPSKTRSQRKKNKSRKKRGKS